MKEGSAKNFLKILVTVLTPKRYCQILQKIMLFRLRCFQNFAKIVFVTGYLQQGVDKFFKNCLCYRLSPTRYSYCQTFKEITLDNFNFQQDTYYRYIPKI